MFPWQTILDHGLRHGQGRQKEEECGLLALGARDDIVLVVAFGEC